MISPYACRGSLGVLMVLGLLFSGVPATAANPVLQTLSEFGVNPKNPQAALVQASDGNFYGTTAFGGTGGENGTIFRISSNGEYTPLFSFNGTNGNRPLANLIQGTDGNLYGTTAFGGTGGDYGTIFKITLNGVFTPLFSFRGTDGSRPQAGLIQGSDGSFYGTTAAGGQNTDNGTLFKITPAGAFTPVYSFPSNARNGVNPLGSLIQHTDGNFFGTTAAGGTGNGTVFRITPSGSFTLLVSFNGPDGSGPAAGLVRGTDGNFYGTTQFGGLTDNGTVFKITPSGVLSSLFSFSGPNGNYPVAPLALGSDGNFYGTSSGDRAFGGVNTYGTAFRITPGGVLITLAVFNFSNGASPVAGLTRGSDGNFYGTTFEGGAGGGGGTIFRLVEPPFLFPTGAAGGRVVLTWISFTNGLYRVQYKPALGAPNWIDLSSDIRATSDRTSFTDNLAAATLRFYRVALLLP